MNAMDMRSRRFDAMMRRGAQDIDERSGTARCRPRQFSGVRSAVLRGLGAAASGGPQTRAARACV